MNLRKISTTMKFHSLRTKFVLVLLLAVVLPLVFLSYLLKGIGETTVRSSVLRDYRQIASVTAIYVSSLIMEASHNLETFSELLSLRTEESLKDRMLLSRLSVRYPVFERLFVVDKTGSLVVSSDLEVIREDFSQDPSFRDAITKEVLCISRIYFSELSLPKVKIVYPIKRLGRVVGALVAELNSQQIWDVVDNIKIGRTGDVSILAEDGTLLAYYDKGRVVRREHLELHMKSFAGNGGGLEYLGSDGKRYLAAYARIPQLGWIVVVREPLEEAYSFLNNMRKRFFLVVLPSLCAALIIGVAGSSLVLRALRALREGAVMIAQGKFNHIIDLRRKDELGELASTFNHMALSLKGQKEQLEKERDLHVKIEENAPLGIIAVDNDGKITSLNSCFRNILGISYRDNSIIGEDVRSVLGDGLADFFGRDSFEILGRRLKLPEGEEKIVNGRSTRLSGGTGFLLVLEDVTERFRMERELMQQDKLTTVGVFASGLAHELKNPLNTVRSGIYNLLWNLLNGANPEVEECLLGMDKGVEKADNIIERMLTFVGQSTRSMEEIDLNKCIRESLSSLDPIIKGQRIEVTENFGDIPELFLDRSTVGLVFPNLLSNSVQSMPEGGNLLVSTRLSEDGRVEIRINDTGCGIPEDDLDKIFTPFFTTRRAIGGTGLGLSLAYMGVRRYGGTINVKSQLGKGATFIIGFPVKRRIALENELGGLT